LPGNSYVNNNNNNNKRKKKKKRKKAAAEHRVHFKASSNNGSDQTDFAQPTAV